MNQDLTFKDDPFRIIDYSKDEKAQFLRNLRDRITCNEREKSLLFETGFTKDRNFNGSVEESAISLEVLALLATSKNQDIRQGVKACSSQVFEFIKLQPLPPSSIHISMFRSFRIIISEVDQDSFCDKYLPFFLSVIEMEHQSLCLNSIKNEIIELFYQMLKIDKKIKFKLKGRRFIKILCSPNLNGIKLLNELMNEDVGKHIKMKHLLERVNSSNINNKLEVLSCCAKLYKLNHSGDTRVMERILYELNELVEYKKESLVLVGSMVQDNIQGQLFCRDIGLVSKIADQFHEGHPNLLTPELLFCLHSLTAGLEENRKIIAKSKIIPSVFGAFKQRVNRKQIDLVFVMIVLLLKSMTKSITFLRSDLLDYPVIDLLIAVLDHKFPDTVDGIDRMIAEEDLNSGFVEENILNVLVNLVMEYGDYKNKFIASNGVEKVLNYTSKFPLVVLQIFKNFLYDTGFNSKEVFIKATDRRFFSKFLDMYEESRNTEILEGCFNLMRNLLCDDTLDYIVQSYEGMIDSIFLYLDRFANETTVSENSREENVLLQILYTVVNLSANSDKFKSLVLNKKHLDNMKKVSTTRNLSIAFIWIIINLSWKEDGSENRVQILCDNGIKEWLIKIQAKDSVLADKIGTALENLRLT
ncbi:uncharacterized protein Eint_050060 [Encephalitozoon intestinalis ATCC 50506]|uniref:Uncharacterized protein n=1 Tax=Encephalitozoon intestinalis (strain ATCC 50506) TaxID=876142 RepID=E0S727_ENCIT|nr:uncharacterized protein Eint_050060 [Encephalitozoon intestinalis ATCC 50506]ADM11455.2 hypothetical protein Eint_050060 [Encephalitozoon intestinalis ATCC 50506]UTX45164.1 hypothetical protein GPK93_05g07080 [Encephalitozoon intestinalis]